MLKKINGILRQLFTHYFNSSNIGSSKLIHSPLFAVIIIFPLLFASFCTVKSNIPEIPGIKVIEVKTVAIPGPEGALAFKFSDGSIVVGSGKRAKWSYDGGNTWAPGPAGLRDKSIIDLGKGEVLSLNRNTKRLTGDKFICRGTRSFDNWKTIKSEEDTVEIPNASYTVTGGGGIVDGFLFHHGVVKLKNGELAATMYGNFIGDKELCDGYPTELNQRKYRTIVVFSKDKGHTWGNPVLVAYDKMLGRGIPSDYDRIGSDIPRDMASETTIVPAITQEGFREADLTIAPNGDLICVMRSGGRNGHKVNLFPTPLYCSRSTDDGRTWTPPEQIADRGVCPNLVTLDNGIIVCTYSRPGNWLIFSDDNGKTWKGAFRFGDTGAYNYILKVSPNKVLVTHEIKNKNHTKIVATTFKVKKTEK